ncbi:hypothetical protein B296_00028553 [Ensete ventricosum]|uniref:Uncharacterized protein n=1 Tax=Ensete ventricosum TaxID=4639 RepID=A0A427A002_ENSVE|nr:hypothetical protein B296_00028553 [Ensete ventricosum]
MTRTSEHAMLAMADQMRKFPPRWSRSATTASDRRKSCVDTCTYPAAAAAFSERVPTASSNKKIQLIALLIRIPVVLYVVQLTVEGLTRVHRYHDKRTVV